MNFPNSTTLRAYEAPMDSLRVTCSTTRYRTKGFISIQIATQFKKKAAFTLLFTTSHLNTGSFQSSSQGVYMGIWSSWYDFNGGTVFVTICTSTVMENMVVSKWKNARCELRFEDVIKQVQNFEYLGSV